MAVYLLHYVRPIGGLGRASAQHYVGYAQNHNVELRLEAHRKGRSGAAIPHAFYKKGIDFVVAKIWWQGTQTLERYIKRGGHFERNCPLCQPTNTGPNGQTTPLPLRNVRRRGDKHSLKLMRESGGELLPGNLTFNDTLYPPEPSPAPSTTSPVRESSTGALIGGTPYTVTAPQPKLVIRSAGTRQQSRSEEHKSE